MKNLLRIGIILVLIAAALGVYVVMQDDTDHSTTLVASGTIEVTEVVLSFKIAGRLQERLVDEGERVIAGQLVARLDRTDQELAVRQARARVAYAAAVLDELEHGSRAQEIADAEAELQRAKAGVKTTLAQLEQARADEERYKALYSRGVVSARTYETIHTAYETALSAYDEAKARVASARERLSLRREGPRAEEIAQAQAQLDVDQETLAQARQQLAYTDLIAPVDGVVLSKAAEPGEYLTQGSPVVTVGNLDRVWLRAYVNETDLGRIRLNVPVSVTTDTYPGKRYEGRISFISDSAEFTPKSVQTFEERVKLMYRIKVDLANPDHELKPGMPADAHIDLSG